MKKKFLLLLAVVALPALAGCGSLTSYAAKVNGQRISQNELDRELNAILGNKAYLDQVDQGFAEETGERALGAGRDTLSTVFVARVLERRIGFEIVEQEFERRKLEVTSKDLDDARKELLDSLEDEKIFNAFPRGYRDELVRSAAQAAVLERALSGGQADAAAVRRLYDSNPAAFHTNCARHILVPDRGLAARIKGRIDQGEDFAAIARAESKDNQGPGGGSAGRGGDLGCVAKGSFVPPFEAALDKLQPGQVSDPVQTQFGFHVVQLIDRKARSFDEAAPEIRKQLEQNSPNALRNFVAEAFTKADITVNPRYGKFVRNGSDIGIETPRDLTTTTTPNPQAPAPAP